MEDLVANQEQIVVAMDQLFSSFKKTGRDRRTIDYINRVLNNLDSFWFEFKANHSRLQEYGDKQIAYFTNNLYEQALSKYDNVKAYIKQCLPTHPSAAVDAPNPLRVPSPQVQPVPTQGTPGPSTRVSTGTDSKTVELLKKQSTNFRAFSRTVSNIDLEAVTEKWEFEDLLKELQSRWLAIDSLHWEIDSELNGADEEYDRSFSSNEKTFKNMKKAINNKLWSTSHRENSTPKMEIPVFSGNYYQWMSFKDLFTETVHNNPLLSKAQKMQFLKSKVKGEAEKLIQHLHISTDNYQACWEILNHRYHNKRLIFTSHINLILNLPILQHPNASQIKRIHDTTNECLNSIKNLGLKTETWDPLMVHIISQKLDSETYNDYMESLKQPRELPTLKEFLDFLENKFTTMESSAIRRSKQEPTHKSSPPHTGAIKGEKSYNFKSYATNKIASKSLNQKKINYIKSSKCPICSDEHGIYYCQQFLSMSADAKRKTIAKLNLCINCLNYHEGKNCISSKTCRECNGPHNTILHDAYSNKSSMTITSKNINSPSTSSLETQLHGNSYVSQNTNTTEILITTAMVKVRAADGTYHKMRALVDQCSQMTLITENAAQLLQLPRKRCSGIVSGIGEKESNCKGVITLTCSSIHKDHFIFNAEAYIMKKIVKNLPSSTFKKQNWPHLQGLQLADSDYNISRSVDIIFGSDVYPQLILDGLCKGSIPTMPVAQQTELGWLICGSAETSKSRGRQCNVIINNLDDIQRFWEVEDITENGSMSTEDQQCIDYYESTTKRKQDGRYEVRLPLIQGYQEKLGCSKRQAVAQFHQLERKFSRNENMEREYKSFINEYIELGHMKRATGNKKPDCILPHHCVLRADSETTALRVVFNASSRTSSGSSLNDVMARGPNLQNDLQSLILKWRQYRFAYTADIEKMFRQIWVSVEDQPLQKIVWRNSLDEPLAEYQLTTVTYGTKSAPFLAMMTLNQLANDQKINSHNKLAIKAINESFYMDDLLHGSHSITSAKHMQKELSDILKSGGFNLRKWASNSTELLQDTSKGEPEQAGYHFRQADSTKTLGLRWNCKQDVFLFKSKVETNIQNPTKRSMLSDISKLFDPLGWLSPLTTSFKILFQSVWQENIEWNDSIPEKIKQDWVKITEDIENIEHFAIPRWLGTQENQAIDLHGFCDASTKAYACVIYCKTRDKNRQNIILVAGKARLVPKSKIISLPKLELMAGHLLAKLMIKVKECLDGFVINTYCWTDSMVVLGWLNGESSRWKPFVENRVTQIKEILPAESWRYVKSSENPADCASRGISATQLKGHSLWWHGPSWLPMFNEKKDIERPSYITDQEVKKQSKQVNVVAMQNNDDIIAKLIIRFSDYQFIIRVVAWLRRIITKKQVENVCYLTPKEINQATLVVIKHHQQAEFLDDIRSLRDEKEISSKSKLLCLQPFLDEQGLLRVGGRLRHAHINDERKHPIILGNGRLAELLIDQAHKLTFHGGAKLCLAHIRQKYWVIGGMRVVKKHLRNCVTCRKHDPNKLQQLMGDLPKSRCNPSPRAFYHTGVDFTGAVTVKANKGRGIKTTKGYVAVFVCMATKAVHLELVSDLSTSCFIAALRRMAARRGSPCHIYSDNGTNFLGANNIIQKEFSDLQANQAFMKEITDMGIQWHFNAPSWPSAGGLWEAAVKSLKYHLKRVIGNQNLTYEEFTTLLTQLEACLNSRPLCPLTEDPDDLEYLTPAHFLTGGSALTVIETEKDLRTRWHMTQKIFQDTWKKWQNEYLDQLTARSKWRRKQENIKINDVVLIRDDNLPAGKWAMGRVTELHQGADGYVRVVTLKTKNGYLKRPVTKLSLLPVHKEESIQSPSKPGLRQNTKQIPRISFNSVVMAILFFMTLISNSTCLHNVSTFKDNHVMYFDKISNMALVRDEWKILAYYDMNPYRAGLQTLNKYIQYLDEQCKLIKHQVQCDVLLLQLQHGYSELEYYDHMLLSQHSRTRPRRGIIDGVGYIVNTLFGVLDQRFADQYQRDIELIRTNQKHMASLWKNQTSIIESEYNVLKRTEILIDKQHKAINQQIMTLESTSIIIKKGIQDNYLTNLFTTTTIIANNMLYNMQSMQNMLIDTVTDIYHGRFNPHLLSPEQLERELSTIAGSLPKDLALPIEDWQTDIKNIYPLLTVKTRTLEQYCLFEIKIPLVSNSAFEIYRLIPIPQLTGTNRMSIVPKTEYVGINLQKDLYIQMTDVDIKLCQDYSGTSLCRLQKPINHLRNDDDLCELNPQTNQCETNIKACSNEWTRTSNLNQFIYFCCNRCQVRILCDDQVTAQQLTRSGIVFLGQGCMIKTENFTLYSHKDMMSNMKIKPEASCPDLMAPINQLFNFSWPGQVNIENTSLSQASETQEELDKIHDQIRVLKENENLPEIISYHNVHHYAAIYVILVVIIIGGIILWRLRRGPVPTGNSGQHQEVAAASAGTNPQTARAPTTSSSESAHYKCKVKSVRLSASRSASERDNKPQRGTSPIVNRPVFTVCEQLV